jgi:Uncharacterized protein conserved in bacteria
MDFHDKKIYFASDFHLGIPSPEESLVREKKLVRWLDLIKDDAKAIFLMGDLFDFWFEYHTVVPKGHIRLLGKITELIDSGIEVHLFMGNHDLWQFGYLEKEIGIIMHREPELWTFNGKTFFLAHGDGLGDGDKGYKFLKNIFECKFNQFLFNWLHPDIGMRLALYCSYKSRLGHMMHGERIGKDIEIKDLLLYQYANQQLTEHPEIDYFIFGHVHQPVKKISIRKQRLFFWEIG